MPQTIREHLNWIAGYCQAASDDNWRDILDRIEEQIVRAQSDAREAVYGQRRKQS